MKIVLIQAGKSHPPALSELCTTYWQRIARYVPAEVQTLPDLKGKLSPAEQSAAEAKQIMQALKPGDRLILLDEKGKSFDSRGFAHFLQKQFNQGPKRLILVIGGPFGFTQELYTRADVKLRLSDLTFSHQVIRLLLAEQLYRAFTILNNEPYHHD